MIRYRSLFCRKCFVYKCQIHSNIYFHTKRATTPIIEIFDQLKSTSINNNHSTIPCSPSCFKTRPSSSSSSHSKRVTHHPQLQLNDWHISEITLLLKAQEIFQSGNDICKYADLIPSRTCIEIFEYVEALKLGDISIHQLPPMLNHDNFPTIKKKAKFYLQFRPKIKQTPGMLGFGKPCYHRNKCHPPSCEPVSHTCDKFCSCPPSSCDIQLKGCSCRTGLLFIIIITITINIMRIIIIIDHSSIIVINN